MSDLFDVELDSGSKCDQGHPLMLVAEGYALCRNIHYWYAWSFTKPNRNWGEGTIVGRDGNNILAWVSSASTTKIGALGVIQADMDARRAMPFDEEAERARLMPV